MANIKEKFLPINEEKLSKAETSNLVHGTATPYLALFTEAGSPIVNPITGIPLGAYVSTFNLKLGDEHEDNLSFTFDTGDPGSTDIDELSDGKKLIAQWGYLYPNGTSSSSKPHIVQINRIDELFDDRGTHLAVVCKDTVANLRSSDPYRPNGELHRNMKTFMDEGFGQETGIIIEYFE